MIPDQISRKLKNEGGGKSENAPRKRDTCGRRLAADITPMEAEEAEALRLQAQATGWRVTDTIEQRHGIRPCAYGWQFFLHVPIGEGWSWVHIENHYWFEFWTSPRPREQAALMQAAREAIRAWEERDVQGEAA